MEGMFRRVVEQVFNNWTALHMAIANSNVSNHKNAVAVFVDYITEYCLQNPQIDDYDIEDVLEHVLNEEYDTICEDGSTKEVAFGLNKFLQLLKQRKLAEFETEFAKLPISTVCSNFQRMEDSSSSEDEDEPDQARALPQRKSQPQPQDDSPMDAEDSEWTKVVRRKR